MNVTCPRCVGSQGDPEPIAECCGSTGSAGSCCGQPIAVEQACLLCDGLGTIPYNEAFDYVLTGEL